MRGLHQNNVFSKNLTDKQEVPKTNEHNIEMSLSEGRQEHVDTVKNTVTTLKLQPYTTSLININTIYSGKGSFDTSESLMKRRSTVLLCKNLWKWNQFDFRQWGREAVIIPAILKWHEHWVNQSEVSILSQTQSSVIVFGCLWWRSFLQRFAPHSLFGPDDVGLCLSIWRGVGMVRGSVRGDRTGEAG